MGVTNHRDASRLSVDPSLLEWAEYWYPISWKGVLAGGVITAIGACATIAFLLLQWRTTTIREEQSDWRTTLLETDTAKAKAELGLAQADIEKSKVEIAQANARTAAAELKLEEFRRARSIGPEQSTEIVEAIKSFSGTQFDIGHAPVGREQWDFLWQLEPVFPKAGWVFVDWKGPQVFAKLNWTMTPHWYGVANVLNVSIEMAPSNRDKLLPAAQALARALNAIGIVTTLDGVGTDSANDDAIHFLVGEKR
jgi:hypothetical protein